MSATHLKAGLRWAMEISRLGNQYLQDAEPWTVLKTNPELCGTICNVAVNLVYLISNIFEPDSPIRSATSSTSTTERFPTLSRRLFPLDTRSTRFSPSSRRSSRKR